MGMLCFSPCVCVWNGLSCTRRSRYWEKLAHGEVVRHWKRLLRGVVEFPPLKCSEKCVGVALEDVVWWWTGGLEYSKVFPNISNSMILSEITIFSEQSQNQSNSVVKKDFHSTRAGPWKSLIKNIKSICYYRGSVLGKIESLVCAKLFVVIFLYPGDSNLFKPTQNNQWTKWTEKKRILELFYRGFWCIGLSGFRDVFGKSNGIIPGADSKADSRMIMEDKGNLAFIWIIGWQMQKKKGKQ